MATNYSFDLSNHQDRALIIKILKALDPSSFSSDAALLGRSQMYGSTADLARQVGELKQKVETLTKENAKLQEQTKQDQKALEKQTKELEKKEEQLKGKDEKISELSQAIAHLNEEIHNRENKLKEQEQTYESLISESEEKLKKETERLLLEKRKVVEEDRTAIQELNSRIESLKKRLEAYEPIAAETGEKKKFKLDRNAPVPTLTETSDQSAPYIGIIADGGMVEFQFNIEKGPHIEACNKKEDMLMPFCDIMEDTDDATSIKPGSWGKAKLSASGIRAEDVIVKAQIRLSRN